VGPGTVWAAFGDSTLARLDPDTNRKTGSTFVGVGPTSVVADYDSVWVSGSGASEVERFSPVTFQEGPVDELTVGGSPTGLASGAGWIWVASPESDLVTRIDPSLTTTSALPIGVGDGPSAIAVGGDAVWVANTRGGTLSRIDPATSEVVETIPVGNAPSGIAVGGGLVWVAVQAP
jgi:YVTN family beta-propeller protein